MRPRHDVDHHAAPEPDPYEVIAFLRASNAKWQETCVRLARPARRQRARPRGTRAPCIRWCLAGRRMKQTGYECGSCGHEAQGYTKDDLQRRGWEWHEAAKPRPGVDQKWFLLCDTCCQARDRRGKERRSREAPRHRCSHCGEQTMVLPAVPVVIGTAFTRALPTSLCRGCDRYPELLRLRTEFEPDLLYPPC